MSIKDLKDHPARFMSEDGGVGLRKLVTIAQKMVDLERRTVRAIVSTATKDRDGDIVEPDGWMLERYRQNPVVLWAHDSGAPPVAKATEIATGDGALRAVAQFTTMEENPRGDMALRLYAGGYLSAFSAGFMPKRTERFAHGL